MTTYRILLHPIRLESSGLVPTERYAVMCEYRGGSRQALAPASSAETGKDIVNFVSWPVKAIDMSSGFSVQFSASKKTKELHLTVLNGGRSGSRATVASSRLVGECVLNVGQYCQVERNESVSRLVEISIRLEGSPAILSLHLVMSPEGAAPPPTSQAVRDAYSPKSASGSGNLMPPTLLRTLTEWGLLDANGERELRIDDDILEEIKQNVKRMGDDSHETQLQGSFARSLSMLSGSGGDKTCRQMEGQLEIGTGLARSFALSNNQLYSVDVNRSFDKIASGSGGKRMNEIDIELKNLEAQQQVRDVTLDVCRLLEERDNIVQVDGNNLSRESRFSLLQELIATEREISEIQWRENARKDLSEFVGSDLAQSWAVLQATLPKPVKLSLPQKTNANIPRPKEANLNQGRSDEFDDFFGSPIQKPQAQKGVQKGENFQKASEDDGWIDVPRAADPTRPEPSSSAAVTNHNSAESGRTILDLADPIELRFDGHLSKSVATLDFDGVQVIRVAMGAVHIGGTAKRALLLRFSGGVSDRHAGNLSASLVQVSWKLETDDFFAPENIDIQSALVNITNGRAEDFAMSLPQAALDSPSLEKLRLFSASKGTSSEESAIIVWPRSGEVTQQFTLIVNAALKPSLALSTRQCVLKF